jgi:hypothetical protein
MLCRTSFYAAPSIEFPFRAAPHYALAYYGRGTVKRAQNNLGGALADYKQAIRLIQASQLRSELGMYSSNSSGKRERLLSNSAFDAFRPARRRASPRAVFDVLS